ncbi:MAG TPA: DUF3293 domain-containing protein [Gammaproteobacteria bacterium]|nr:DUF3293 domain-containing protein [Gammaproteobacteria bacterium]
MIDAVLAQAWREAIYTVKAEGGTARFAIGQPAENIGLLPPCRSVAVVTAWNPKCGGCPRDENDRAQIRLLAHVREHGYRYFSATGASPDGTHVEESLAVLDLDEEAASALGARFGQGAVMYWDGGEARLIWMPDAPART